VLAVDPSLVDTIQPGLAVEIRAPGQGTIRTEVRTVVRRQRTGVVVGLADVGDRDHAQALAGGDVYVDRKLLPPLGEGEFYDFEILGAQVTDPEGNPIGEVVEILSTGANDIYIVRTPGGHALVAAVAGIVLDVDAPGGRIVVDPRALEYADAPE
jgi:16S rRNA processing protein RimM